MGRTPCCDKSGLKKGPWTPEEDQKLIDYIQKHGYGNWRTLPKNAGLQRCGKSCRLRWTNYLRPDIKRGRFSFEEEETIIQLHSVLGNKWSAIAARLPGRTDNEIKNYWNTHIRKRLLRMGIDPVTHNPRLDLLDLSSLFGSHLYNQTHTNLSRLLGVVDPQLLKLATSLISNQNQNSHTTSTHHHHHHDHCNNNYNLQHPVHQVQTQIPHEFQANYNSNSLLMNTSNNCDVVPTFCDQAQSLDQFGTTDQYWMHNVGNLDCVPLLPSYCGAAYDQATTEPSTLSSEPSNLYSSTGFGFNVSTPSSSPTPLNSSSTTTYNNNGGSSCCTMSTDRDERESYCSGLLKFEVPDLLDVSELL